MTAERPLRPARPLAAATVAALLLGLLTLLTAAPAQAFFGDDEARKAIIDLRGRVADNDKRAQEAIDALARKLETAQRSQLELVNQNDLLRQEIARLRGQIDTLANELANQQKRSRDLYGDLDARLKALEPRPVSVDGRAVTMARDEQAAYDAALVLFRAQDFAGAIRGFQSFLVRYPQSAYVAAAHYWTGTAHYALKDYKSAIAAQQVVVERFADSPRAPEALLNIAASQAELNQRPAARTTLQRLLKDYPDSDSAKVARERLAALGTR
ncbi:MAG: tol-pal system protein YbgF [Burkholderiaceae bacterium]|nr:tol-pal system protein YbgF [Burkholderiaceae bacterium]